MGLSNLLGALLLVFGVKATSLRENIHSKLNKEAEGVGSCTVCDGASSPQEASGTYKGALTICQPGDLNGCEGTYSLRQTTVPDLCAKADSDECFTLRNLTCGTAGECLMWGDDAYAGQALIPAGVTLQGWGSWECSGPPHTSQSGGPYGTKLQFWEYGWRVDAFKVSINTEQGYTCTNGVVSLPAPTPPPPAFHNYVANWIEIAAGADASFTAEASWDSSSTSSTSTAFTSGLSIAAEAGCEIPFCAEGNVTTTASLDFSHSAESTLERMNGGSNLFSCDSTVDCSDGRLYQWKITAENLASESNYLTQCFFACVPSHYPGGTTPKCPPNYCGNLDDGCQCCNSDAWVTGANVKVCN